MKKEMKKLIFALLTVLISLSLLSCDLTGSGDKECSEHTDKDTDGVCDICGEMIEEEAPAPDSGGTAPNPDDTGQSPDGTPPTQDSAPDEETEYTLTFISQGTVIETVKIKNGESFEPPTPSRGSEYILLGWRNSSTGEKITDSIFAWNEDITLTAIWDRVWSEGF